jgi:sporulation protein YlmC with PRC-barrel domain
MIYPAIGLFFFGLLFAAGSPFAEEMAPINWNAALVSDFIGAQVTDIRSDNMGQIQCFTFDATTGRIANVVLSDVPRMGSALISIPFSSLTMTGPHTFVYNPPPDDYAFYGQGPNWYEGFALKENVTFEGDSCGDYLGATVQFSGGGNNARVNDFVIDFGSGYVAYAVLDFPDMGDRLVAVPVSTFSSAGQGVYVVSIDRDRLLAAPAFVWVSVPSRTYAGNIYLYYGIHPYWELQ